MTVTGPDWPSTRTLRSALAGVESTKVLNWGRSPCDKAEALRLLSGAGLAVPSVINSLEDALWMSGLGMELWGRNLHHSRGTDISRRQRTRRWRGKQFWVQYIPSVADYRVHVWNGKCFRMGVKVHPDEASTSPIRSAKRGWTLSYSNEVVSGLTTPEMRTLLRDTARAACAALGVVGGAVDLLEGRDGRVYVLEVNTAPALGEHTMEAYVRVITKWATRRPQPQGASA